MRLIPSPGRIVVKEDESIVQQRGLIIAPDTARRDCARFGIVMAVGTKPINMSDFPLSEGDLVMFHVHESMPIKIDGEEFYVVDWSDVLGKLRER